MIEESLKLKKDLREASKLLSAHQARYFVKSYYQMQDYRIQAANQIRSSKTEPIALLNWLFNHFKSMENEIKRNLDIYSDTKIVGKWSKSICGIGPVVAGGLMAHVDIEKAPTVGHIWNFAGINPNIKWEKNQKRPFNAKLKVLCWKIGQSFVKQSNRDSDIYGNFYKHRKLREWAHNLGGVYEQQALDKLAKWHIDPTKEGYKWYIGEYSLPVLKEIFHTFTGKQPEQCYDISYKDEITCEHGISFSRYITAKPDTKEGKAVRKAMHNIYPELESLGWPKENDSVATPLLPPAHIQQRAERWATKIFLSHWHHVAYYEHFNEMPPKPFAIAHLGHAHEIAVPNWPFESPQRTVTKKTNESKAMMIST